MAVQAETTRCHLHTAIIPGGCTKYIQAADVVWNTCFKSHLQSHYDTWLATPDCYEFTHGGNLKPPSQSLLCNWVKASWEAVPVKMVKESFLSCAIITSLDGTDDKIHCFKTGQPCEEGRSLLESENQKRLDTVLDGYAGDPFAPDTNEEKTENNEAVIEDQDEPECEVVEEEVSADEFDT